MKQIVAIIRPERLACVQLALKHLDIELMTVAETHTYGEGEGHTLIYRSSTVRVPTSPKLRLEIVINDWNADEAVEALTSAVRSQQAASPSEGRIFVTPVEDYVDVAQAAALHSR